MDPVLFIWESIEQLNKRRLAHPLAHWIGRGPISVGMTSQLFLQQAQKPEPVGRRTKAGIGVEFKLPTVMFFAHRVHFWPRRALQPIGTADTARC